MPESVTDRPTKAHEYLFLLSKSPRYFYDADAVRETYADGPGLTGGAYAPPGQAPHGNARGPDGRRQTTVQGANGSIQHDEALAERWPQQTQRLGDRHRPLPRRPLRHLPARTRRTMREGGHVGAWLLPGVRGTVGAGGRTWTRRLRPPARTDGYTRAEATSGATCGGSATTVRKQVTTTGWRPTCDHPDLTPVHCVVLDPFMGSGTTAQVARRLGRRSIGIELNLEYAQLAARRLQQLSLFATETEEA